MRTILLIICFMQLFGCSSHHNKQNETNTSHGNEVLIENKLINLKEPRKDIQIQGNNQANSIKKISNALENSYNSKKQQPNVKSIHSNTKGVRKQNTDKNPLGNKLTPNIKMTPKKGLSEKSKNNLVNEAKILSIRKDKHVSNLDRSTVNDIKKEQISKPETKRKPQKDQDNKTNNNINTQNTSVELLW